MAFLDTNTGNSSATTSVVTGVASTTAASVVTTTMATTDSITVSGTAFGIRHVGSAGYMGARFIVQHESTTVSRSTAGTYNYTAIVTSYTANAVVTSATVDFTITIAALASASKVANAGNSSATVASTSSGSTDEALSLEAATSATNTEAGYLVVRLRNASGSTSALGGAARESVTIVTDKGQVGTSTNRGRSVVLKYDNSDYETYNIYSDGTSGIATINISTPSITFAAKTVNFYAAAPKTLTTTVLTDTLKVGSNSAAIGVKAVDATGIDWTGTLYVYSDTVGTISNDASSCSYSAANARHECSLTGVTAGTAKITVRDAATVAASTVSATAVTATVSTASAAKFTMAWDKASYVPGEKATLTITVVDSEGKAIPAGTLSNLYASGGITLSTAAGNGSATDLTTVNPTTASPASASNLKTLATPVKTYTIYMPTNGGTIEASATGGSSLPVAGQVKVTAKATITDNAAAALAAVNALATTVASLRTLITTLTNLVLKIQKKVKA
jgi:hypothetical protein